MTGLERHAILVVRVTVRPAGPDRQGRAEVVVTSSADLRTRRLHRVRLRRLDDISTVVRTWLADQAGPCGSGDGRLTPGAEGHGDERRSS